MKCMVKNISAICASDGFFDCIWCCLKFSFHDSSRRRTENLNASEILVNLKITSNIQYRIEHKTVTLGGIFTLSKEGCLLALFCAAFFFTLFIGYGHERG